MTSFPSLLGHLMKVPTLVSCYSETGKAEILRDVARKKKKKQGLPEAGT